MKSFSIYMLSQRKKKIQKNLNSGSKERQRERETRAETESNEIRRRKIITMESVNREKIARSSSNGVNNTASRPIKKITN